MYISPGHRRWIELGQRKKGEDEEDDVGGARGISRRQKEESESKIRVGSDAAGS
jgi:hypothetical protein